jgi:GNAT superfamily N-acetyltransferase
MFHNCSKNKTEGRFNGSTGHVSHRPHSSQLYRLFSRHGYGPVAQSLHFIGYAGEQPVTSGTLLLSDGIPGLYNISTPLAARGRGYGQALTAHMLQEAITRGYTTVWTWASDDGRLTYEKLGFVQHDFGVREYPWRASVLDQ